MHNLLIIIVIKINYPTYEYNPTQPNSRGLGWVGLNPYDRLGSVGFFLTNHGGLD